MDGTCSAQQKKDTYCRKKSIYIQKKQTNCYLCEMIVLKDPVCRGPTNDSIREKLEWLIRSGIATG